MLSASVSIDFFLSVLCWWSILYECVFVWLFASFSYTTMVEIVQGIKIGAVNTDIDDINNGRKKNMRKWILVIYLMPQGKRPHATIFLACFLFCSSYERVQFFRNKIYYRHSTKLSVVVVPCFWFIMQRWWCSNAKITKMQQTKTNKPPNNSVTEIYDIQTFDERHLHQSFFDQLCCLV